LPDGAVAVWLRFIRVKPTGRGYAKEAMGKLSKGKTENIYSLTGKQGEGMTPKKPTKSRT
jgi:hypothetical protein